MQVKTVYEKHTIKVRILFITIWTLNDFSKTVKFTKL